VFPDYFKDNISLIQSSSPVHMLNKGNVQLPQINISTLLLFRLLLRK